jgi:putative transposase
MAKQLHAAGSAVGRVKARRLRRDAGGVVRRRPRRGPVTTDRQQGYAVAPHLLARQCAVDTPEQVGAGDMTSVWTAEGWLDVAVLLDLYARKVVGWAMRHRLDAALGPTALRMALGRRGPVTGRLPHAARGSQDAWHDSQRLLAIHGLRWRMSRTGECVDNAVAKRCFGSVKRARIDQRHSTTRQEAKADGVESIEMFYHRRRQHSSLGSISPNAYEALARVA